MHSAYSAIRRIRDVIPRLGPDAPTEAPKHDWRKLIADCHDPCLADRYCEWSGRPIDDVSTPGHVVEGAYNSGQEGNIDYSFLGDRQSPCFWFVYDSYDGRTKIWVLRGSLGGIVDCLDEVGWLDYLIRDLKGERWIHVYRDTISYCRKGADG